MSSSWKVTGIREAARAERESRRRDPRASDYGRYWMFQGEHND